MLGEELLDVIHRYPDHVWVFLHEFPALTGERGRAVPRAAPRVRATGRGGPRRPASSPASSATLDPRLTARAWLGMHNYTYLWLKPGGRLSARDVAKPFADIFMRGIADPAPKRRRSRLRAPSSRRRRRSPSRSSSGSASPAR